MCAYSWTASNSGQSRYVPSIPDGSGGVGQSTMSGSASGAFANPFD